MAVLVTGGAGYIGSHFVRLLKKEGVEIIVLDNLSRGHRESLPPGVKFAEADLLSREELRRVFSENRIESVVHFAAFAYVGESVESPLMYYQNNVVGSYNLLEFAVNHGVKNFVFSSTCSLYGNPDRIPITESESVKPINPYAKTKQIIEMMLADYSKAYGLNYAALRYFNAAGAAPDGETGESHDPEPHLIPLILQTALGKRSSISIFGDDYETKDGTCIRDYIHILDLGRAHLLALEYLRRGGKPEIINLGTGDGNSVKEVIERAEMITDKKINRVISPRREGDPAILVADNKKAGEVLGWRPEYSLDDILIHAWNWHKNQKY